MERPSPQINWPVVEEAAARRKQSLAGHSAKQNRRILLLSPPYTRPVKYLQATFPLGLGYIAAVLERENFDVAIYNAEIDPLLESNDSYVYTFLNNHKNMSAFWEDREHPVWKEIEHVIREFDPAVIGFSVMTNKSDICTRIVAIAKGINPKIITVAGGYHPTLSPADTHGFDYIIRGEGEHSFLKLMRVVFDGQGKLSEVSRLGSNPEFPDQVVDIEKLPHPAKHLVLGESDYPRGGMSIVISSRGCPFSCTYCSSPAFFGRRVYYRPFSDVIDEITELQDRYNLKEFYFADDTFTIKKPRVHEFCRELIARNMRVNWSCITRLDLIDEETLDLMKQSGCNNIWLGVESGTERILEVVGKDLSMAKIRSKVGLLNRMQMPWSGFFMIGLPSETVDEMWQTYEFMKELNPAYAEVNIFNPLPGTDLYHLAEKQGKLDRSEIWCLRSQASLKNLKINDPTGRVEEVVLKIAEKFDEHNAAKKAERAASSPVLVYNRASNLEREGQFAEAKELFKKVLSLTWDAELQSGAHYHLGRIAKSIADLAMAAEHFCKAVELNPSHRAALAEANSPLLIQEGWLRPSRECPEGTMAGADGEVTSAALISIDLPGRASSAATPTVPGGDSALSQSSSRAAAHD
ncbi:MAG: cobalamin B12-binding domain-containing protein [Acidobacteria bacterium]|nr:cobalamin B12-binding domain-containing protein [Acidobacteriota bacterium]